MTTVVPAPVNPSLPIAESDSRFPIRRVYCVGRNYADHAKEMGADPDREPPFFFAKPADAVFSVTEGVELPDGSRSQPNEVPYPPQTSDFQHEIELVVGIGRPAFQVDREQALATIWGYGVGVDLTRRDLQSQAKELRRPWDLSKGFDASAPVSPLRPVAKIGHPDEGRIWLDVEGDLRQEGDLRDQIWPVADVIAHLSAAVALRPGDLIFTGTPAGVGRLQRGEMVSGGIDGVGKLSFRIS